MKLLCRSLLTLLLTLAVTSVLSAQDDPNPNSAAPELLSGMERSRVLAVENYSFRGKTPTNGETVFTPGRDRNVTVFLNARGVDRGESPNAFRVYATRSSGKTYEFAANSLTTNSIGHIALTFSIFDISGFRGQPAADGDYWLYVTWRGMASNTLRIGLGSVGGVLPPLNIAKVRDVADPEGLVGYRWSADRIRFLEQTTFGPTTAMDERLRRIGLRTWLNEQFEAPYPSIAMPNPPQMPTIPQADCGQTTNFPCYQDRYTLVPLQKWFFQEAMYGDAQLRHRMSWILSQIWVTSGVVTQQSSHAIAFHKILSNNAFGNYRQLMSDATLSPTMGNYLDTVRSTSANPNENYPREILQLFSIGLFNLNQDGTQKLDNQGNAIPTFDQETINNLSKVFTGWNYCNTAACPNAVAGSVNYKDPMVLTPSNHDLTAKTLLSYPGATVTSIPACTGCTTDSDIRNYAKNSLDAALDNIFNHPNVGPYIGKLLIQHMVTSDPSPAYVSRVAAAFNNNGYGVRGDMKAVIRAIVLDPEARGDVKTAPRYGKMREPVQIMTSLTRNFPALAFNGEGPSDGGVFSFYGNQMGQNPFYAPTVFNYFLPDHVVAGTTILAPEFDIFNTGTAVKRTNMISVLVFNGFPPNATDSLRGSSLNMTPWIPFSEADASGAVLVDALNARMLHSTMSAQQRSLILTAVQAVPATDHLTRVRTVAYLIAASSQYQIQR